MEKVEFFLEDTKEAVEFHVLEQTRINGSAYILVTDPEDEEVCLILKDLSSEEDQESVYEIVEEDTELEAVSKVFEELLEDTDIRM